MASTRRPNVVVFFTDQQRWDTIGAYGSPLDLTPNLDRLAARSVRFERAFTCQPVCGPARASLQTGLYAAATGVFRNGEALPEDADTLARRFGAAGYRTGYIGKWHLSGTRDRPAPANLRGGYDHWIASDVLEFTSHPYEGHLFDADDRPVEFTGWRSDFLTEKALEFIDAGDGPFFLFVSYIEPHFQNDMERFVAPDGYAARYARAHVPPDLAALPGDWMSELPDYYGMIARLDENLETLLAHLDARGLTDETIVLFMSDHGCHFRTRNAEYKRSCHDSSIRIPMVLAGPGLDRRLVVPEVVSLVDVPPTLLAAAGVEAPAAMHGRSMLPLLDRRTDDWPEEAFLQISESEVGRCIRTARWTYSVYAPDGDGWEDPASDRYVERYLYDNFADPHQLVNLVGRRTHRHVADELRGRLIARIAAAGEMPPTIDPAAFYA